jgi:hypothetical protein
MINRNLITAWGMAAFCLSQGALHAQVYSQNIVGYYNLPIYAGNNLVANQLDNASGDSLDSIFQANVPEGATFTEWDSAHPGYLPVSTYDTNTGWSINYVLTYGEGGLFDSPTTFTNTFAGSVWSGYNPTGSYTPPLVSGSGLFLVSSYVPFNSATFYDVTGRNPQEGDYVQILNALTQTETTTTFHDGAWNNGDPLLGIGESAFFGIGQSFVTPVPEPSVFGLFGAGLLAINAFGRLRRKNQIILIPPVSKCKDGN